ncbi:hypothetical protein HUN42_00029 [Streptomyces phage Dagobah]|nr:hypothetical protein HUN42_00029 [Streptomyces phage Dagobah]
MITTILIAAQDTPTEMSGKSWAIIILVALLLIGGGGAAGGGKGGRGR